MAAPLLQTCWSMWLKAGHRKIWSIKPLTNQINQITDIRHLPVRGILMHSEQPASWPTQLQNWAGVWPPGHDLRLLLHSHCLPGVLYPCVTARENLKGLSLHDCNNDVEQQKEKKCPVLRSQQEGSQNNSPVDKGLWWRHGKQKL